MRGIPLAPVPANRTTARESGRLFFFIRFSRTVIRNESTSVEGAWAKTGAAIRANNVVPRYSSRWSIRISHLFEDCLVGFDCDVAGDGREMQLTTAAADHTACTTAQTSAQLPTGEE